MNVCVLGGSGFVGTELVTRLVHAGHWVRVPTRNLGRVERLRVLETAELRVANVHEPQILSQLFADCDAVVNLIGILNSSGRATFETVHVQLAASVLAAARRAGVRRLLHMSALGADQHGPSRYLRSKGAAEALLRAGRIAKRAPGGHHPAALGDLRPGRLAHQPLCAAAAPERRMLPLARAGARFAPMSVYDVAAAFVRALQRSALPAQPTSCAAHEC